MASSSDTQAVVSYHQPIADEPAAKKVIEEIETNNREDIRPTKDNGKQDKKEKPKGDNCSHLEITFTKSEETSSDTKTEVPVAAEVEKVENPPSTNVPSAVNTKDADNSVSEPEASIILDSTSKAVEEEPLEKPASEATENLLEILSIETYREMSEVKTEIEAVKEVAEEKLPVKLVEILSEEKPAIQIALQEEKPVVDSVENLPDKKPAIEAKFKNLEVEKPLVEAVDILPEEKPAVENVQEDKQTVEAVEILSDEHTSIEAVENVKEGKPEVENVQKEKSAIEAIENVQEEKPAVEKVQDKKPAVEDVQEEKPTIEAVENARGDKPEVEKVQEEKPVVEYVQKDKPTVEAVEILSEETPAIVAVENVLKERPAVENVQEENPAVEDVLKERPAVEDVLEEKPAIENAQEEKPAIEAVQNVQEKPATENVQEEKSAVEEVREKKLEAVENVEEEKPAIENVQQEKASDQNVQEEKPSAIISGAGKVNEDRNADASDIDVAEGSLKDETIVTEKVSELKKDKNPKPGKDIDEKNEKIEESIKSERIKNGDANWSSIVTAAEIVKSLEVEQGSRDLEVDKANLLSSVEIKNGKYVAEKVNETSAAATNAAEATGDVKAEERNKADTNLESTKETVDDTNSHPPTKETSKGGDDSKTSKDVHKKHASAKPAQKSSGNILSKVKQSIGKVKKAIIGKSPSSKPLPPEAKGEEKVN